MTQLLGFFLNGALKFVISLKIIKNVDDSCCTWGRIQIFPPINVSLVFRKVPLIYKQRYIAKVKCLWGHNSITCTKRQCYHFIHWFGGNWIFFFFFPAVSYFTTGQISLCQIVANGTANCCIPAASECGNDDKPVTVLRYYGVSWWTDTVNLQVTSDC